MFATKTMKQWKEFYKKNPVPKNQLRMTDKVYKLREYGINYQKLRKNHILTIKDIYDATADAIMAIPKFKFDDLDKIVNVLKANNLPELDGYILYDHRSCCDSTAAQIREDFLNEKILWFDITARTFHALERAGVKTIRDLKNINIYKLGEMHKVGPAVVKDLEEAMYRYNI